MKYVLNHAQRIKYEYKSDSDESRAYVTWGRQRWYLDECTCPSTPETVGHKQVIGYWFVSVFHVLLLVMSDRYSEFTGDEPVYILESMQ